METLASVIAYARPIATKRALANLFSIVSGHDHDGTNSKLLMGGKGRTFYVDYANGDDDNDGLIPTEAFKSSQAAIDACTHNYGDRIIRLPGTETVTEAVDFNVKGLIYRAVDIGY